MSTSSAPSPKSNPLIDAFCQRLYAAQVTEYQFQQDANFICAFRDNTPDLLLELHADGTILNLNHPAEFDLFRTTTEVLQRNIAELLPVEAACDLRRAVDFTLREQKPAQCEWTILLGQKEHHFEVRVACLRPDRVLLIIRDITLQQQALNHLREFPRLLLDAHEQERARLSYDLHGEIGQDLTAIILAVYQAEAGVAAPARQALEQVEAALQALTRKVRRLAQDLHPATLQELGLTTALDELLGRFALQISWHVDRRLPAAAQRCSPEIEIAAYRIAQEALTNVARHAQARHVKVDVRRENNRLLIQIEDDGQGFEVSTASQSTGYGLRSMRDRASLLGGRIHIQSTPGQGAQISAELPLNPRNDRRATT